LANDTIKVISVGSTKTLKVGSKMDIYQERFAARHATREPAVLIYYQDFSGTSGQRYKYP